MQRYPGSIAPCDHRAQTSQTDGQTDGHWHRSIRARCIHYVADVYITSRAKNGSVQWESLYFLKHVEFLSKHTAKKDRIIFKIRNSNCRSECIQQTFVNEAIDVFQLGFRQSNAIVNICCNNGCNMPSFEHCHVADWTFHYLFHDFNIFKLHM